jgi:hypothetical protein
MARFVVSAVPSQLVDDSHLVVSVSSADDGHPRDGLRPENFRVAQLANLDDTVWDRPVAAVTESLPGVYRLHLASNHYLAQKRSGRYVLAVIVSAPPHGGGADFHGQTLAAGALV